MHPWNRGLTLEDPTFARSRELTSDTLCRRYWPKCREAMELYMTGITQREVAERLDIGFDAAKNRIRRYWDLVDRFGEEATE